MTINFKKALGSSLLAALVVGGVAFTAAAPASADTVDTGIKVKAAVQGDRLEGPLVSATALAMQVAGMPMEYSGWLPGADNAGVPRAAYGTSLDAAKASADIFSIPAPGTTGPVRNSGSGLCWEARLVGGNYYGYSAACNGSPAQDIIVYANGQMSFAVAPTQRLTDRRTNGAPASGLWSAAFNTNWTDVFQLGLLTPVPAVVDCTDGLTGTISNVNHGAKSAVVGGKGKAGETITVTGGPAGPVTAVVNEAGNWTATVVLATGDNAISVTSSDNCAPVELSVIIDKLEVPIAHPAAAAAAGVLGLGVLGFGGLLRRRATARI